VTDARRHRFEEMYRANYRPVLGYVVRRSGNPDDAADVIAETFLTAWRRLDDVPAGEAARPWLLGVAWRVLANHGRAAQRQIALGERLRSELTAARYGHEPSPGFQDAAAAFRGLSQADREILTLAGWEGLEPAQIAVVLGCSANAARIRLHRARRRFAGRLRRSQATTPELEGETV
jgi:RNA polymerase sigma factor (sigma-70 family)